jgi:hypothetical protein
MRIKVCLLRCASIEHLFIELMAPLSAIGGGDKFDRAASAAPAADKN